MTSVFNVSFRRSAGNLHIRLQGEFGGLCAWEVIKTIYRRYTGSGRVFVNTEDLNSVLPMGVCLFKRYMTSKTIPLDRLYLKGEKGFAIAPDGARVVIRKKPADKAKEIMVKIIRRKDLTKKMQPVF